MSQDWMGIQNGQSKHKAEIIDVGLKHSLATQYTSFVAVETKTVIQDGKPVRIEVPVELPENVSPLAVPESDNEVFAAPDGLAHNGRAKGRAHKFAVATPPPPPPSSANETVEVTANAPMVDTESAQVTHTFDGQLLHPQAATGGSSPRPDKKEKQELLKSKLSADLLTLYECAQKAAVGAQSCTLPKSGSVTVEVKLSAGSAKIDEKLAAAGFAIKSGSGTAAVTGEIAISQLQALVEIAEVQSVRKVE